MPPVRPTGTIAVNPTDLHYGDRAVFEVTASEYPVYVEVDIYPENYDTKAVWSSPRLLEAGTSDDIAFDAPQWPDGPAHVVAELCKRRPHKRPLVIATLEFEVQA